MSLRLYLGVHVPFAITAGLELRQVDVLTAQADQTILLSDPDLLDRAGEPGRVIFTQDEDFLRKAQRRQSAGEYFAGVIYAHQLNVTIGQCVNDLELIAKVYEPEDILNQGEYLQLK